MDHDLLGLHTLPHLIPLDIRPLICFLEFWRFWRSVFGVWGAAGWNQWTTNFKSRMARGSASGGEAGGV